MICGMCIYIYIYILTHVLRSICVCVRACMYMCVHIYIYIYVCTHTHIYVYPNWCKQMKVAFCNCFIFGMPALGRFAQASEVLRSNLEGLKACSLSTKL